MCPRCPSAPAPARAVHTDANARHTPCTLELQRHAAAAAAAAAMGECITEWAAAAAAAAHQRRGVLTPEVPRLGHDERARARRLAARGRPRERHEWHASGLRVAACARHTNAFPDARAHVDIRAGSSESPAATDSDVQSSFEFAFPYLYVCRYACRPTLKEPATRASMYALAIAMTEAPLE